MRSESSPRYWSATSVLLIVNAIVFLFTFFGIVPERVVRNVFALSLGGLEQIFVWQFVTFQFLHAGPLHLIFNLLIIYFFGRAIEEVLGRASFLKLYFLSGIAGGVLQMLFALLLPASFGGAVLGASAGALGLIAAFAAMFPERQLALLLFFIIPVSMRAKTLLWISVGLALFGIVTGSLSGSPNGPMGGIAHAAHLGGLFAGLVYVFCVVQGHGFRFFFPRSGGVRRTRELVNVGSPRRSSWRRPPADPGAELPSAEFISREVDPILDKISAHGIQSLTENEKRILEAARAKMSRR